MPSILALRAILGASLGFGALDLVWINLALAPQVLAPGGDLALAGAREVAISPAASDPPDPGPVRAGPEADPAPAAAVPHQVYFATTSAELDAASRALLAQLVRTVGPGATLVVEGHADHRGPERFNRALSKQRAVAVRGHLERLGIPRARIRLGFVGEDQASAGEELWRDRRVDIQVGGGGR